MGLQACYGSIYDVRHQAADSTGTPEQDSRDCVDAEHMLHRHGSQFMATHMGEERHVFNPCLEDSKWDCEEQFTEYVTPEAQGWPWLMLLCRAELW